MKARAAVSRGSNLSQSTALILSFLHFIVHTPKKSQSFAIWVTRSCFAAEAFTVTVLMMNPKRLQNDGPKGEIQGVDSPRPRPEDGWISSDQLAFDCHDLYEGEVEAYLAFQFGDIAYRPPSLALASAASVVRYLRQLAVQGVPREIVEKGTDAISKWGLGTRTKEEMDFRNGIDHLALAIWHSTIQFADIKPASAGSTRKFLRDYACFLPERYRDVVHSLDGFRLPPGAANPFQPPRLVSRQRSVQGTNRPRQMSDLSERIAVADYALKEIRTKKRLLKIAESMNALKVPRAKTGGWDPDAIRDRVKKYRRGRFQSEIEGLTRASIHGFRFSRLYQRKAELEKAIVSRGLLDQLSRIYGWSLDGSASWRISLLESILLKPRYTLAGFIAAIEAGKPFEADED